MIGLYRLATRISQPAIAFHVRQRAQRGKEDRERLDERFGKSNLARPAGPLIWLHGASVGETLSALPVIKSLLGQIPALTILVTSGTLTSAALLKDRLPDRAMHQFMPVDTPQAVKRFLDHWQPDGAIWLESELWPNMITLTSERGIPMTLVNGRLSEKSFRGWKRFSGTAQRILGCFQTILAQTETDLKRFQALGLPRTQYLGNLKEMADPLPADPSLLASLQAHVGNKPLWLAASTHPGEEASVLKTHMALKSSIPGLITVLVPRHPERRQEIIKSIKALGLPFAQRSRQELIGDDTEVFLGDTLGELGVFFRLAPIAFIGGSLSDNGGHNPLEASRLSTAVLFGPHMENFTAIAENLIAAGAAIQCPDEAALTRTVRSLLRDKGKTQEMADQGLALMGRHQTHLNAIVETLINTLGLKDSKVQGHEST